MKKVVIIWLLICSLLTGINYFLPEQYSAVCAEEIGRESTTSGLIKSLHSLIAKFMIPKRSFNSSYNYGDQTVQFKSVVKKDNQFVLVGLERKAGLVIKIDNQLKELDRFSVEFPIQQVLIAGNKDLIVAGNTQLQRITAQGIEKWEATTAGKINCLAWWGNDLLVAGTSDGEGWVSRFNQAGQLKWANFYGGPKTEVFNDLAITKAGNIILVGSRNTADWQVESAGWVVCLSPAGKKLWANSFVRPGGWSNSLTTIIKAAEDEFLIAGADGYLLRITAAGQLKWQHTQPGFTVRYTAALKTGDEEFMLAGVKSIGRMYGGGANDYPYLVKVDSQGNRLNHWIFSRAKDGVFNSLIKTENNLLAAGAANGQSTLYQTTGYLIKMKNHLH